MVEHTLRTFAYLMGIAAVAYADLSHSSVVFSVLLPLIVPFYMVFLVVEFFRFFVPSSWESDYTFFDLLYDIFDLQAEAEYSGYVSALINLVFGVLNFTLLFSSLFLLIRAL